MTRTLLTNGRVFAAVDETVIENGAVLMDGQNSHVAIMVIRILVFI